MRRRDHWSEAAELTLAMSRWVRLLIFSKLKRVRGSLCRETEPFDDLAAAQIELLVAEEEIAQRQPVGVAALRTSPISAPGRAG